LHELWSAIEHRFGRRASISAWFDGQWAALPQGGACEQARAALQLVSRRGVLSEAELLEFRSEAETLAAKLGVPASSPGMKEALDSARRLDQVCANADIQIAFHVVSPPGAPFSGTKLRAAAEAAGFALDPEGRYALVDDRGRELYNLADRGGLKFSSSGMKDAAPQALTLSMDVPRVPDTHRTFDAMVRFARNLANLLGGALVDDNNQPLDERAVAAIDAQLTVVCASLETQGVVPGSALALRLFS
jgi:FtsZ-interacting cell division protein ZipA